MFPPMVPWFRSCGLATAAAACASARYRSLIVLSAATAVLVVSAPIRSPPAGIGAMPFSSFSRERLTSLSALKTSSRRQPSRSVPPAWSRAPGAASCRTASATDFAWT